MNAQPPVCDRDIAEMSFTCETACVVCDIDGFTGRHLGMDGGELPDGFCTNTVHNARWIAFQAGSTNLRVEVTALDCRLNNDSGLEMGIYKEDQCDNFQLVSECFGAGDAIRPDETKVFTNTEPLVIGQHYYIAMDGARGDNCDWLFTVLEGSTAIPEITDTPPITGVTEFGCDVSEQRFSIPPLAGALFYDWTLDGTTLEEQTSFIDLTNFTVGVHELCVTPRNVCTDATEVCFSFEVLDVPVSETREIIGPSEFCDSEIAEFSIPSVGGATFYEWTIDGMLQSSIEETIEIDAIEPGNHTICVLPKNNCNVGEQQCFSFFVDPSEVIQRNQVLCDGDCYTDDDQLICELGTFRYSIPNGDQCDITIEIQLREEGKTLDFPNVIVPNGNNRNDRFQFLGGIDCDQSQLSAYQLTIFDRWGNVVFRSNNEFDSWDGSFDSNRQQNGLFIWHVSFTLNEEVLEQSGTVMVIH